MVSNSRKQAGKNWSDKVFRPCPCRAGGSRPGDCATWATRTTPPTRGEW